MKRLLPIVAIATLLATMHQSADAALVTFRFDPNSLMDLLPTTPGDPADPTTWKATQQNSRRLHQVWSKEVASTFYDPQRIVNVQPDGFNTHAAWQTGLGEGEGISCFNVWLLDNPRSKQWGEYVVANPNWQGTATAADGWSSIVSENPWGEGYFAQFWTSDPALYLRPGGADIGEFSFTVDAFLDDNYPLGWDPSDTPLEVDQDYRLWFGAANSGAIYEDNWSLHYDADGWGDLADGTAPQAAGADSGWEGMLNVTAHNVPISQVPEPWTLFIWAVLMVSATGAALWQRRTT